MAIKATAAGMVMLVAAGCGGPKAPSSGAGDGVAHRSSSAAASLDVSPAPTVPIAQVPPAEDSETREMPPITSKTMNNDRLDALLRGLVLKSFDHGGNTIERHGNAWKMVVSERDVLCITDEHHDRMRIVAPVADADSMTQEQRDAVLAANFHTALDARYAVHDGVLYSAFIHPLSPLTEEQVDSALKQVVSLALTYGTTYSSSNLTFGGR